MSENDPAATDAPTRATITADRGAMRHDRAVSFDCPRCGARTDEDLYGPCPACRGQLRAAYDGHARADVVTAEYEPKMNVTPNNVASRE